MCRVGGKSKAVESVVATCGYPPVAPRTFVSRNRRKLYCISPVVIAGLVTNRAVNEIDLPLAMQMDPTTLQLIQFLERTVSSGECVESVPIVPSSPTSRYTGPRDFLGQASVFSEYLVSWGTQYSRARNDDPDRRWCRK